MNTYNSNMTERQPNHPISTLNTFVVISLYCACLYQYLDKLNVNEEPLMVHVCLVYPGIDLILILISLYSINKVKHMSRQLIDDKRFKEYNQEAEIALADILFLPQEFESDDGEEDF